MTGSELKQLHHDLGDAIGRRLSVADMAMLCGLAPKNGADTFRKWEEGDGPSGPVAALVSIFAYASQLHPIPEAARCAGFDAGGGTTTDQDKIFRAMIRAEIIRRLGT